MKINSVIVGIQYHEGVKSLNKGDVVELSFNGADDEFPTGIRVLNNDGVVIGNIIAKMNHPSISDDIIVLNDLKNNSYIRKVTTNNCKAVVVGIKRYVVFITINTDNVVSNEEITEEEGVNMAIEQVYVKPISKEEEEVVEEEVWKVFNGIDEMSAKGYFKDNKYIVEAYYEDENLYKVSTERLEKLGFKQQNGDETMELKEQIKEVEAKMEKNREERKRLRYERRALRKELTRLEKQLEEVENNTDEVVEETTDVEEKGETMEEKIAKINKESIIQSVMERNIKPMTIELMQNGLEEGFEKAKEEYPMETMMFSMQYIDLHPIANVIMTIRSIDDLIALKYLNGQISGGEFDHMRAWIGIHAYFYYEHIIEEVSMEEFFTEASLKASEKFLKEQEDREYRDDDEDCGNNTTSSSSINNNNNDDDNDDCNNNDDDDYGENPTIEFVSWTQQSYAWCGSDVTIKVNGKEITLKRPLISGGNVWFDDDWGEHVEDGPWSIREDALPNNLKAHIKKIEEVVNENIPEGCCGGCV